MFGLVRPSFTSKVAQFSPQRPEEVPVSESPAISSSEEKKQSSSQLSEGLRSLNKEQDSTPDGDKIRESINSVDLERQAIGVSLPPFKPVALSISSGFSQLISPVRPSILVEIAPFSDFDSPIKTFKKQVPCSITQTGGDPEPFYPIILPKDLIITDFSNRPASPRIDSYMPKQKDPRFVQILQANESKIPTMPKLLTSSGSSNPFNMADSFLSQQPRRTEGFSEKIIVDNQEYQGLKEFQATNEELQGLSEEFTVGNAYLTPSIQEKENADEVENQEILEFSEFSGINHMHIASEVQEKANDERYNEEIQLKTEECLEFYTIDENLSEEKKTNDDGRYNGGRLLITSPDNMMMTPDIDFVGNGNVHYPGAHFETFSEKEEEHISSKHFSPDANESFHHISTPSHLRNRSHSREFSGRFYNPLNNSHSSTLSPIIRVSALDGDNKDWEQDRNGLLNIPSIRASINSSGIFSSRTRVHFLRNSPKQLTPALFEKNLQGKLTADEELEFTKQ